MCHLRSVVVGFVLFVTTPLLARQATQADVDAYVQGLEETTEEAYDDCLRAYLARVDQDQCVDDYRFAWAKGWRVKRRIDFSLNQQAQIKKHSMLIDLLNENTRVLLTQKIEIERRANAGDDGP